MASVDDWTWPELVDIVEGTPGALEQLLVHLEGTGKIPKELTRGGLADEESSDSVDDQADELSQAKARQDLTSRLLLLVSNLRDVRKQAAPKEGRPRRTPARDLPTGQKRADDDPHLWWFPVPTQKDQYNANTLGGTEKRRIGSLASHIGLRDEELRRLLATAGAGYYSQWGKLFGVPVQSCSEGKLTYLALDEPADKAPYWSHLPRDQVTGANKRPAWVGRPKNGWMEGVTEDDVRAAQMSRATLKMIDNIMKGMEASEIMAKLEESAKRSRAGIKNNVVKYTIADRTFELPCNYQPVRKKKYSGMEEELKELRHENVGLRAVNDAQEKLILRMKENAAIGAALASAKDKKQRPQNDVADTLYATMQAVAPKASPGALAKVVPLAVAGYLTSLGIDDQDIIASITNVAPSEDSLRNVLERAGERVHQTIARIAEEDSPIALAFDKGMRAGIDRFVKEMTHFDHADDKVVSVRINSDGAKGQNSEAAEAIDCSLKEIDKYRNDDKTTRLVGQCTDSGGGGTKEGVAEAISLIDRADDNVYYIATCALHALSKSLQNATENSFGENGLGEETFLQLLHTCWSAQEALGENFDNEWNRVNPDVRISRIVEVSEEDVALLTNLRHDEKNDKIQKPLLTRWWHVNVCALQVLRTYDAWVKFVKNLYESRSERSKIKTISQNAVALISSDKIRCDLEFFCAFSHAYWTKHMKWMHRIDEVAKTFGHSSRLMLVRCVLMIDDLTEAKKMDTHHWTAYKSLREALPDDDHSNEVYGKQTAEKQAERFFKEYESTLRDNVQRWWGENLLPLAIGGSGPTATVFAQWLLELPAPDLPPDAMKYHDQSHGCEVDLNRLREFLDELPEASRESVLGDFIISRHEAVIEEKVAAGVDLWGSDVDDDDVLALRKDVKSHQVIIKHHTQSTEAGVQEIALCSSSGRDESSASALSAYRSFFLSPVNAALAEAYHERDKKGNQHLGKGKGNEREVKSQRAMRKRLQDNSKSRGRYDVTSKSHLKTILEKAIESSPTEDESKVIRKQINKRNAQGDAANAAKKLRLDQEASRRQEDETKLINRSNNRAQIPDASNISTAKAKPPPQFTKDLSIGSIRKKDQIKLVLKELEARYTEEDLAGMGAYAMTITKLRAVMQEYEDCAQCICPPDKTRGPNCKCKKATTFHLEDTEIKDWIDDG